jgi:hypothetical protein
MSHQTFNYGKDMSFTDEIIDFIKKQWLLFYKKIRVSLE